MSSTDQMNQMSNVVNVADVTDVGENIYIAHVGDEHFKSSTFKPTIDELKMVPGVVLGTPTSHELGQAKLWVKMCQPFYKDGLPGQ